MSAERDQQENEAALARMRELGIPVTASAGRPAEQRTSSEPKVHDLKVQTQFWADLEELRTTAQLRQDDRQYRVGDVLNLREFNSSYGFTGKSTQRRVTHILRHEDVPYGVRRGWCILSTALMHGDKATFAAGWQAAVDGVFAPDTSVPMKLDDAWAVHCGEADPKSWLSEGIDNKA